MRQARNSRNSVIDQDVDGIEQRPPDDRIRFMLPDPGEARVIEYVRRVPYGTHSDQMSMKICVLRVQITSDRHRKQRRLPQTKKFWSLYSISFESYSKRLGRWFHHPDSFPFRRVTFLLPYRITEGNKEAQSKREKYPLIKIPD